MRREKPAKKGSRAAARARRPVLRDQRGISHCYDFHPGPDGGAEFKIRGIPRDLWAQARERAKRENISMRAVVLQQLRRWVERSEPRVSSTR